MKIYIFMILTYDPTKGSMTVAELTFYKYARKGVARYKAR